ncbi:hypothetical protein H5410_015878 [Solanum commersonii]|uniref:Uncharacterized protein n=1 Tax=Solanum commersonii TaxID=4109 RepID=A0A9J5ZUW7_SOLCO|nr:hypothetical protein H5410_015878 [Solanum commersonii]
MAFKIAHAPRIYNNTSRTATPSPTIGAIQMHTHLQRGKQHGDHLSKFNHTYHHPTILHQGPTSYFSKRKFHSKNLTCQPS